MERAQDDPAPDPNPAPARDDDAPTLCLTVVRYEDGPDRATLAPAAPDPDEECTAWLTVDRSVLRSLDSLR